MAEKAAWRASTVGTLPRPTRLASNSEPTKVAPILVHDDDARGELVRRTLNSGAGAHFNHAARAYSVAQPAHAFGLGAVRAAEKCAFLFEPVADDMNSAISADRSERMDRALEAIEGMGPPFMLT